MGRCSPSSRIPPRPIHKPTAAPAYPEGWAQSSRKPPKAGYNDRARRNSRRRNAPSSSRCPSISRPLGAPNIPPPPRYRSSLSPWIRGAVPPRGVVFLPPDTLTSRYTPPCTFPETANLTSRRNIYPSTSVRWTGAQNPDAAAISHGVRWGGGDGWADVCAGPRPRAQEYGRATALHYLGRCIAGRTLVQSEVLEALQCDRVGLRRAIPKSGHYSSGPTWRAGVRLRHRMRRGMARHPPAQRHPGEVKGISHINFGDILMGPR